MLYDLIVIGLGPAGYTAGIYASRYNLKTLLIGSEPGGLAASAHKVENWPGEPSISGSDLMKKFSNHVNRFQLPIKQELIKRITSENNIFTVITEKTGYQAKTIILAMGASHRHLNIPGEDKFRGKGVSYCSTCDATFFKDKNVAVIGGGNSAFMAANHLSDIAKKTYIIYYEPQPKAMPTWVERVEKKSNVVLIPQNTIKEITGENLVNKIILKEKFDGKQELFVDGVFIEIGVVPNSQLIDDLKINKNSAGYIQVNPDQSTNLTGAFAAGDITTNSSGFAQMITASAEGAIAVNSVYQYLNKKI